MAAVLDRIPLRRHRSAVPLAIVCRDGERRPISGSTALADGRPRLFATWHAEVDGRLACTWSASAPAPDIPPT